MPGWVPMDASLWPLMVEVLQDRGEPWPEEACLFDLRWLHDQEGRLPGRRKLRKRWRVTDRVARRLLASVDDWWDPIKGSVPVASRSRPGGVPPASRSRPGADRAKPDNDAEMSRSRPGGVPPASRSRPGDVHTRVDPPSPSPSPSPGTHSALRAGEPDEESQVEDPQAGQEVQRVWDHWRQWHQLAKDRPSKVFRRHVSARLAEGRTVEQLCAVATWAHTAEGFVPERLRQGQHLGPETLYKPTRMLDRIEAALATPALRLVEPEPEPAQADQATLEVWRDVVEHLRGHSAGSLLEQTGVAPVSSDGQTLTLYLPEEKGDLFWMVADDVRDALGARTLRVVSRREAK